MSGTGDQAKGRIKEAAGSLTGDDDLKNEGKVDGAGHLLLDVAGRLVDKVKRALTNDK